MDEWLFISLAKTKAEASNVDLERGGESGRRALTKADTVAALDLSVVEEKPAFRGAAAFVAAVLVNATLLVAIDDSALDARTPKGEVIVAQIEPLDSAPVGAVARTYEAAETYVR